MSNTHSFGLCAALVGGAICFAPTSARAESTVTALVASNAAAALRDIAAMYEKAHPGVKVVVASAGSKVIMAHLDQGDTADMIVVGSTFADGSKAVEAPVGVFANHTVIAVPKVKSKVLSPKDLALPGLRLGNGTIGSVGAQITDETLAKLAKANGADFPAKVKANVTSVKTALEATAMGIEDGSIDAAILFAADAESPKLAAIDLGDASVVVDYSAAVAKKAQHPVQARELIAMMKSSEGQQIFAKHHHDRLK